MLLVAACTPPNTPEPTKPTEVVPPTPEPDPEGTIRFTESDSIFANPERGLFSQSYFTSADLTSRASAGVMKNLRKGENKMTLYLHSYYLTDYMESDIPQEFLDRLDYNMNQLREGGAKVVLRFSYKSSMEYKDKPWNATPEWIHRHIDQVTPYLQQHADVILCVQCGWLGSWGEWYYTDNGYKQNPTKDSDFEMRWEVLDHMLSAVPETRQVALRIPAYKMRYLKMHGDTTMSPLTAAEAYQNTPKARICGHNDCFVSSSNDVGTYNKSSERDFWAADSKYTFMGGETCEKCSYSIGTNALKEMKHYHWTYLNRDYRESVTTMWRADGTMDTVLHRLGYRLVLDKIFIDPERKEDSPFEMACELRNVGYAAPINPRGLELIFVSVDDPTQKFVYPQQENPRFWLPGEVHKFTLSCNLNSDMHGEYKIYLNLPDPEASLHDNPLYSIRLANENCWDENTGYNYLTTVTVN